MEEQKATSKLPRLDCQVITDNDTDGAAIVGICRGCERVVFASEDSPERSNRNAREVAKLIRQGYRVENWPDQKVRESKWGCRCSRAA